MKTSRPFLFYKLLFYRALLLYLYINQTLNIMKKTILGAAVVVLFLSACNQKTETTVKTVDSAAMLLERNKQVALNSDIAFNKHDVEASIKDYSADFVEYGSGTGKPMKNLDSIKTGAKDFLTAFPDFKGEDLQAFASGDTVVITGTWSGTFKSEFMKIKPTGKVFKAPDADIFTFNKEGKITSHKNIQSNATFFYQLDIPMPPKKK
jgi:predicted ester cyclase